MCIDFVNHIFIPPIVFFLHSIFNFRRPCRSMRRSSGLGSISQVQASVATRHIPSRLCGLAILATLLMVPVSLPVLWFIIVRHNLLLILVYGNHPVYMEHRYDATKNKSTTHGVFLLSSNGMDVLLRDRVLQYRIIGGTLDIYFFSGGENSNPTSVITQYVSAIGTPA